MRGKTRRWWKRVLLVLLLWSACWPGSGSVRLARLIYHVKYVSSDIIFCRRVWDHPRITCPSDLPTADRTASVTITPVRKPEKWVVFTDGHFLAKNSQKNPQTKENQPSENFKNDQVNWIRPLLYFFCLFKNFVRKIGQQFWLYLHSLSDNLESRSSYSSLLRLNRMHLATCPESLDRNSWS